MHVVPTRAFTALVPVVCSLGLALVASSQTPPPLPTGPGTVRGQVVHPDGPDRTAGVPVVLYGLSSSGEPGLASTQTDLQGRFVFEGVSNAEDMAYLVAARFREIPFFGPRVQFAGGATETTVEIPVTDPTRDVDRVDGREVIVQLEWAGPQLAIQEIHRLHIRGTQVLFVDQASRGGATPAFELDLPQGATRFVPISAGFADQVEEREGHIRFWGPLYPGDQELRFQYTVPVDGDETTISFALPLDAATFSLMTSEGGPRIRRSGPGGVPEPHGEPEVLEVAQEKFFVHRIQDVQAGAPLSFVVQRPPTSSDPGRIRIKDVEAWVEYDDARVVTNLQLRLAVAGAEQIASAGSEPLLQIPLPSGARRIELSADAHALGASESDGVIGFTGPFPPGDSRAAIRFQLDATPDGRNFALRFPLEVAALNVLVADTGIAVESSRLHQRRPFREGTRIYLHREAFHVEPNETVSIGLRPLSETRLGNAPTLGITFLAVAAACFLLARPLLAARTAPTEADPNRLSMQREALLQDIRDIDHDFETGKLAEADHRVMRSALRARAVALLREERFGHEKAAEAPATSAGCPGCGGAIEAAWTFCSNCGADLGRGE